MLDANTMTSAIVATTMTNTVLPTTAIPLVMATRVKCVVEGGLIASIE